MQTPSFQTNDFPNTKTDVESNPQPVSKKGKTAKQIMARHLKDKNDVITEDELKELDVRADVYNDTAHDPLPLDNDPERPKDESKDHNIITAWDVIK